MFLVVSMTTMKFIKGVGVPFGTMWVSILFVFLIHPFL